MIGIIVAVIISATQRHHHQQPKLQTPPHQSSCPYLPIRLLNSVNGGSVTTLMSAAFDLMMDTLNARLSVVANVICAPNGPVKTDTPTDTTTIIIASSKAAHMLQSSLVSTIVVMLSAMAQFTSNVADVS